LRGNGIEVNKETMYINIKIYILINAILSFSFLQSKEKERMAKKEKEKHANVFYALTSFGCVCSFCFAKSLMLAIVTT